MYNYYGKPQNELTDDEKILLGKDQMLFTSMNMNMRGESLLGMNMRIGTDEDIRIRSIDRTLFVCKLLGIPSPRIQKTFTKAETAIEKSRYGFDKFLDDFMETKKGVQEMVKQM